MTDDLVAPGGLVRLYLDQTLGEHTPVTLTQGQHHYLRHVLRAKAGARLRLFNAADGEWLAAIAAIDRRHIALTLERRLRAPAATPPLWLLFAPIKRAPIDRLIEMATELGASVLQPVRTARTIVTRLNLERLAAHAIEAAEQCDRLDLPEIRPLVTLVTALDAVPADWPIVYCDEAGAPPIAEAAPRGEGTPAAILIGPEGGFAPEERALIRVRANALPVSLGPRIMRADTAAVAALAAWQSRFGDWRAGSA